MGTAEVETIQTKPTQMVQSHFSKEHQTAIINQHQMLTSILW